MFICDLEETPKKQGVNTQSLKYRFELQELGWDKS